MKGAALRRETPFFALVLVVDDEGEAQAERWLPEQGALDLIAAVAGDDDCLADAFQLQVSQDANQQRDPRYRLQRLGVGVMRDQPRPGSGRQDDRFLRSTLAHCLYLPSGPTLHIGGPRFTMLRRKTAIFMLEFFAASARCTDSIPVACTPHRVAGKSHP